MVKTEIRLAIMDERMHREESILATSPHKSVANAVRYARAMNCTLSSTLDKKLKLLHQEFEREFRRIVEVQQEAYEDGPSFQKKSFDVRGYTRKQFRYKLNEILTMKRREDELRRAKTQLSLPSMSNSASISPAHKPSKSTRVKLPWQPPNHTPDTTSVVAAVGRNGFGMGSLWKHDGDAVYFPPI
ncbi:uncharacterized protein LOC116286369 [Actinia tenebrosa]|uniref:Uncharacterized protein LOC116286369 n=1 Tax=Actinia tenebrosa TaxID=6105 RepID=A0A6P8GWU1_ACTTE|nr:uncharacterized protein LOC116286369 [Actinia tenebrosa]